MTAGKAVDDNGFEWLPYGAHYPDFLRLKDVAVTFFDRGERNGIPQACSIRFDRRTRLPILCSSKTSHQSPVKYGPWDPGQTERTWGGGQGARQELHVLRVGPQVAIRLVKPYEAYEHTLSKFLHRAFLSAFQLVQGILHVRLGNDRISASNHEAEASFDQYAYFSMPHRKAQRTSV